MITTRLNNLVRAHQQARALVGKANQGKALHGPAFRWCHKTRLAVWEEIEQVRCRLAWNLFARYLIGRDNLSRPNRLQVLRAPHWLTNQRRRNVAAHQALERIRIMKVRIQPGIEIRRTQHQRNALIVDMGKALMGRQGDCRKGKHLVITVPVPLPQASHRDGFALRVNVVDLTISPFVKRRHRHDTALLRIHALPKRTSRQPIRARVKRFELGVGPVPGARRVRFDQKGPDPLQQLPAAAVVQHELRSTPRCNIQSGAWIERHTQSLHQPLHQGIIRHVESTTHNLLQPIHPSSIAPPGATL